MTRLKGIRTNRDLNASVTEDIESWAGNKTRTKHKNLPSCCQLPLSLPLLLWNVI